MKKKPVFFLFAFSLVISLAAGFYASNLSKEYYTVNEYAPDPMDGLLRNQNAYNNVVKEGRISTFVREFQENKRTFFTTAALVILAPEFLKRPDGHLLILIPLVTLFLFLLGYCIWLRTRILLYSITAIIFYITCYAVTEPYFGIGFNMPDTIAAYPIGIAALCLLIWFEKYKTHWLILFAIFISISVLIRFIFSVYTFLIFSIPLILIINHQSKILNYKWKEIFKVMSMTGGIILILCGYYLYSNYQFNSEYYSYWLDAGKKTMKVSISDSIEGFIFMYSGFLRKIHALFLFVLFISGFYFFHNNFKISRQRLIIVMWMFFILPFYWTFILKTNGHIVSSVFMAAFPVMFVCMIYPLNTLLIEKRKKIFYYLLIIVTLFGITDFLISVKKNSKIIQEVNSDSFKRNASTETIASMIKNISPRDCTLSLYALSCGYLAEEISLESFYSSGRFIKTNPSENKFFLYTNYCFCTSNKNQEEIDDSIFQKINQTNNILVFIKEDQYSFSNDTNVILKNAERSLYNNFSSDQSWRSTEVKDTSLGHFTLFYRSYLSLGENQ